MVTPGAGWQEKALSAAGRGSGSWLVGAPGAG